MKPVLEVHPVQGKILRVLLFQPEARFSHLNPDKVRTDHFNFHLQPLLGAKILEKGTDDLYRLTAKGKEFANRFDTEKIVIERQAKLSLAVVAIKVKNGKKYYLIQQRLKQPYFGYFGVVNGKIRWGEKIFTAAARELFEETGLVAKKMSLVGLHHKSDYTANDQLLEDKFFFRVRVDKFSGKFKESVPEGKNFWLTKEEIFKKENLFPDMKDGLAKYDQDEILFTEKSYIAQGY